MVPISELVAYNRVKPRDGSYEISRFTLRRKIRYHFRSD
jgi:hypothetical protein